MPVYVRAPAVIPVTLGSNSAILGKSYFNSTGTSRYDDQEPLQGYRVYLDAHASKIQGNGLEIHYSAEELFIQSELKGQVHLELIGLPERCKRVLVNGRPLTRTKGWKNMMRTGDAWFLQNKKLFVSFKN